MQLVNTPTTTTTPQAATTLDADLFQQQHNSPLSHTARKPLTSVSTFLSTTHHNITLSPTAEAKKFHATAISDHKFDHTIAQTGRSNPNMVATLFDVPSGYVFKRRNPQTATASEVAPARKSHAHTAAPPKEMHLISDAVKLIKAKERRTKAQSVISFFKKF
jgi:hypothetical protein